MPFYFTIVKYNFLSQCFNRLWNLFRFKSERSERDDRAMRRGFHRACLPSARLSLAEGDIRRVQMPHDHSKLRLRARLVAYIRYSKRWRRRHFCDRATLVRL